jgi:hypothetical protein
MWRSAKPRLITPDSPPETTFTAAKGNCPFKVKDSSTIPDYLAEIKLRDLDDFIQSLEA